MNIPQCLGPGMLPCATPLYICKKKKHTFFHNFANKNLSYTWHSYNNILRYWSTSESLHQLEKDKIYFNKANKLKLKQNTFFVKMNNFCKSPATFPSAKPRSGSEITSVPKVKHCSIPVTMRWSPMKWYKHSSYNLFIDDLWFATQVAYVLISIRSEE